jgi:phage N-6-adenine-methyltransferase
MNTRLDVHYSSRTDDWSTPDELFSELDSIFHFELDACASPSNAKCPRFFTKDDDALKHRWRGTVWMNPPYGREISAFMEKAFEESLLGATVVCLVPSRTDTQWWHRYAKRGQIIFLKGRLKFGGSETSAPFPSAIVIFWGGRLGQAVRPELTP